MWPIRDVTGDVVGFGARRLYDDDRIEAKYLNTAETPLYKKSQVLYGVDLAKRDIARERRLVVVEGYTDVMAAHLAGVTTAVATCGTAFGDDHARTARRLIGDVNATGEIIFTFDGDSAGQKAAMRAFAADQQFVARTFVAVEPSGKDPCDLRQAEGDAAVRALVDRRVPLFEFAIRSTFAQFDLDTEEGRLGGLDAAAPIVASIKDRELRYRYAVNLDRWLGFLDEAFVVARVARAARNDGGQQAASGRPRPASTPTTRSPPPSASPWPARCRCPTTSAPRSTPSATTRSRSPRTAWSTSRSWPWAGRPAGPAPSSSPRSGRRRPARSSSSSPGSRSWTCRRGRRTCPASRSAWWPRSPRSRPTAPVMDAKRRLGRLDREQEPDAYAEAFARLMDAEKHQRSVRERAQGTP